MLRTCVFFIVLWIALAPCLGQEKTHRFLKEQRSTTGSYTNVIPGYFTVDFGFHQPLQAPRNFKVSFWPSNVVNVYYTYPIRLGKSSFSFVPSLGFSLERFRIDGGYALSSTNSRQGQRDLVIAQRAYGYEKLIKSVLVTNYIDFPIGFRFDTKPDDLARSIFIVLGARVGGMYESFSKFKYTQGGQDKVARYREQYNLNPLRYGVFARVGIAGFNLFVDYNISPYFEPGKGPDKSGMNTVSFGISISNL